jgi:hypothetical protein
VPLNNLQDIPRLPLRFTVNRDEEAFTREIREKEVHLPRRAGDLETLARL